MCLLQVKACEGVHDDPRAVEDIRRAFDRYPDAAVGLIVSTADEISERFDDALRRLREETGTTVELVYGTDLARLVLRCLDPERSEGAAAEG